MHVQYRKKRLFKNEKTFSSKLKTIWTNWEIQIDREDDVTSSNKAWLTPCWFLYACNIDPKMIKSLSQKWWIPTSSCSNELCL